MQVRIVSEGWSGRTWVTNADTGEPIDGVVSITWKIDARNQPVATAVIEVEALGGCEVVGELEA